MENVNKNMQKYNIKLSLKESVDFRHYKTRKPCYIFTGLDISSD